jgi:hypothetical protein
MRASCAFLQRHIAHHAHGAKALDASGGLEDRSQ